MRRIGEAIFYVLRCGCPWRLLPDSFPPWGTVCAWFTELRDGGVFENLNHHVVLLDRARVGREWSSEPLPGSTETAASKDFERTIQSATAFFYAAAALVLISGTRPWAGCVRPISPG